MFLKDFIYFTKKERKTLGNKIKIKYIFLQKKQKTKKTWHVSLKRVKLWKLNVL